MESDSDFTDDNPSSSDEEWSADRDHGEGPSVSQDDQDSEPVLEVEAEPSNEWSFGSTWTGKDIIFTQKFGVQVPLPSEPTVLQCFKVFFSDEIVSVIVQETNRYAEQKINHGISSAARLQDWKPVDDNEIREFFSLIVLMGVICKPTYEMYWSRDPLLETKIFPNTMSLRRFELILSNFHFVDNENLTSDDRLRKIRPMLYLLQKNFQSSYFARQEISVDESLMLFKGRLVMKQYIPMKRARFGIKIFFLCEVASGYAWDFSVYTGKGEEKKGSHPQQLVSHSAVTNLVDNEHLNGKGYKLYVDRWFTSPALFRELDEKNFGVTGTVNPRKKGMPSEFLKTKVKKGEVFTVSDGKLLAMKWHDKKDVYMLSNMEGAVLEDTGKRNKNR